MNTTERRAHPRSSEARPGKLYDHRSGRYLACASCNLSAGGALLEVGCRLAIRAGDRLYLGLSQRPDQVILSGDDLIEIEVLRALPTTDNRQGIAVRFLEPNRPGRCVTLAA